MRYRYSDIIEMDETDTEKDGDVKVFAGLRYPYFPTDTETQRSGNDLRERFPGRAGHRPLVRVPIPDHVLALRRHYGPFDHFRQ